MERIIWKICNSLREHAKNIRKNEKKKLMPLTKEELKLYQDAKVWYICEKGILKFTKDINHQKDLYR